MTPIRMVVADVDGTLLRDDKTLSPATVAAVTALHEAGIVFTLASARPPLGLRSLAQQLRITEVMAAFNGAALVAPTMGIMTWSELSSRVVQPVANLLEDNGLDMWAYCGLDWFVQYQALGSSRVNWETECVGFAPQVTGNWSELPRRPLKLVGVSEDPAAVEAARDAIGVRLRTAVSAATSTPFYLDITAPGNDKGTAVQELAALNGIRLSEIAVIGDGHVDIPMFLTAGPRNPDTGLVTEKIGLSIAMGNAPDAVKMLADVATASNQDDGFAEAVRKYILA